MSEALVRLAHFFFRCVYRNICSASISQLELEREVTRIFVIESPIEPPCPWTGISISIAIPVFNGGAP